MKNFQQTPKQRKIKLEKNKQMLRQSRKPIQVPDWVINRSWVWRSWI